MCMSTMNSESKRQEGSAQLTDGVYREFGHVSSNNRRQADDSQASESSARARGKTSASSESSGMSGSATVAPASDNSSGPGLLGVPPADATSWNAVHSLSSLPPASHRGLSVEEVREIADILKAFLPAPLELHAPLKPFLPDFIPAVSSVDPMIKPPRPDGEREVLGWKRLDEPAPVQSDPTVLDLRLRALSKKSGLQPVPVRSIERADKSGREISRWIDSMAELHRSRPPPSVHYTRPLPDIDSLMQEWPPALEAALRDIPLPSADMDLSLEEYARLACSIVGIPVYPTPAGTSAPPGSASAGEQEVPAAGNQLVQALHVLLTLYQEFKSNPHFASLQGGAGPGSPGRGRPGLGGHGVHGEGGADMSGSPGGTRNRLEIRRAEDDEDNLAF